MAEIKITLRKILDDREMTLAELSTLASVRFEAISNLTRGKVERLSLDHLQKVMTALDITDVNLILQYVNEPDIEVQHDPLDDNIEMLDLPPVVFNKIRRHSRHLANIRQLTELDFKRIPGIGVANLKVLNAALDNYLNKSDD